MKQGKKTKKVTIDGLAIMVAEGFERIDKRLDKDFAEVKEDVKDVRRDILNLGDKFVSYHTFDLLAHRVKVLEQKKK